MTDKMTIQEAITELNECYLVQSDDEGRRRNKAVTMAIESLEKQIPKKPTRIYRRLGIVAEGKCPVCGEPVVSGERCSSNSCGQAIDWSDKE